MRIWKQWTDEHRTTRKTSNGRPKVTSAHDDRHLHRMAMNDRTSSSRKLAARWCTATGVLIGILYHFLWGYCGSSGRDADGGCRFHIERSKMDHSGPIILRSGDCAGQGWPFSAKLSPYFSKVIILFRVTISPVEKYDMTVHIVTDLSTSLRVGRKQLRSYARAGIHQTWTSPVAGKSANER
ncbi:transposable element Tcb2 transposase [Trichonephila clavipes]|nr:transposable element Tcb2 transposase [Trichonephila clavipes]